MERLLVPWVVRKTVREEVIRARWSQGRWSRVFQAEQRANVNVLAKGRDLGLKKGQEEAPRAGANRLIQKDNRWSHLLPHCGEALGF